MITIDGDHGNANDFGESTVPTPMQPDGELVVTVVHTAACHYCQDARAALTELGREYSMRLEDVDATSPPGLRLLARHRVPMLPLVVVDGQFFSYGRLPRGKLRRRLLEARQPAGTR
jgi:glutaredoxin